MDMEISAPAVADDVVTTPVDTASVSPPQAATVAVDTHKSAEAKNSKTFTADQMRIISNSAKQAGLREEREKWERLVEEKKYKSNSQDIGDSTRVIEPALAQTQQTQTPAIDEESLYKNFRERQQRELEAAQVQENTNNFLAKIQASGKVEKIMSSGLGKLTADHPLIPMLNSLDNISDVIDEFDAHPTKLANIVTATYFNPQGAFEALRELSGSLQQNREAIEKAKSSKVAQPPIQLKPSNYGLSGGESTIADKRKNSLFKF